MTVLAIIIAVIVLILISPVGVRVHYKDSISLWVYFGALRIKLFPLKKKDSNKKKKKPSKNGTKKASKKSKDKKKKSKLTLDDILKIVECALISLKKLILSLRIKRLHAYIVISGNDAASAAINYGRVCTAVSLGYSTLDKVLNERNTDISVDLEYDGKTRAEVDIIIKAMLLKLIIIAVKALFVILPLITKKDDKKAKKFSSKITEKKGGAVNERSK